MRHLNFVSTKTNWKCLSKLETLKGLEVLEITNTKAKVDKQFVEEYLLSSSLPIRSFAAHEMIEFPLLVNIIEVRILLFLLNIFVEGFKN